MADDKTIAKVDALKVKAANKISPAQEKLKIAKELYRDNPTKVFSDAVEKAKEQAKKEIKPAAIVSPVKRPSEAVMKKLTGKK